ncbi:MAG TPA: saccharopine dehydrogenase NADP-binding domain-containing protein [Caldimonas sp.]|nr:saccharopine dehydrogenase NADP-binding domain-containing protein [Caldimonas sp.]HEX4235285.1 saccharopine dehydrogenase NADP-binding domain-containing protein [Caldimonas sp.]
MNAKRTSTRRSYDVVLYGATGFVGRQTVAHFAAHADGVRWALAGRSAQKLEQVRQASGRGAADAGIIVADATDSKALDALAGQAAVVLSTAGPFALYGSALVAACVAHRTDYVDITGETPWVRGLIDRHHAQAARDGTRIIPCCGFDSVPSDLGAWLVAEAIRRQHGEPCVSVKACHSMRGGLNGGTLASALTLFEAGQDRLVADLFLLNPPGTVPRNLVEHADPVAPHHDADFNAWVGPFMMGPVNTRVVRRTAALLKARGDAAYGARFGYQEYMRFGRGPLAAAAAVGISVGMGMGQAAMRFKAARELARAVAVSPGQGPSERTMDGGSFRCELVAKTASGKVLRGRVAGQGDPGNRATTTFVCESALALATQPRALPGGERGGGVLTPASGLGLALAQRLIAAGITLEPMPI